MLVVDLLANALCQKHHLCLKLRWLAIKPLDSIQKLHIANSRNLSLRSRVPIASDLSPTSAFNLSFANPPRCHHARVRGWQTVVGSQFAACHCKIFATPLLRWPLTSIDPTLIWIQIMDSNLDLLQPSTQIQFRTPVSTKPAPCLHLVNRSRPNFIAADPLRVFMRFEVLLRLIRAIFEADIFQSHPALVKVVPRLPYMIIGAQLWENFLEL